jgi:hypothetical protein
VAVLVDRLDEGGGDPAHGVEDKITGVAVRGDDTTRDLRQHLRRVPV